MISNIRKLDSFTKNIIVVFCGASFANFLGLLYQLFIAHKLTAADFAAFNALLSVYSIIAAPIGTLQAAVAKYSAAFNAQGEQFKIKHLLSGLLKNTLILAAATLVLFWFVSERVTGSLKISSASCIVIFALSLALAWPAPVFSGAIQGLELFGWLSFSSVTGGVLKLLLAFLFILSGYGIAGALGAFLASSLSVMAISYLPLRRFLSFGNAREKDGIDYSQIIKYLLPVGITYFCFNLLSGIDMVLVRSFFAPEESGFYSLAQMLGKIFLFLPGAVSVVMFPRTSGLNARNMETTSTLARALFYVLLLGTAAACFYNFFPSFVLKVLTGKVYPESILLGRFFSVSMTLFAVLYIFVNYFLSIKDLRFLKYLVIFSVLQAAAIAVYHHSLVQVQLIVCVSSILLCLVNLALAFNVGTGFKPVPTTD